MKKMIRKPQYFFILLSVIVLICGFVNKGKGITINFDGVFMDLDVWSAAIFSSLFLVMISVNYLSLSFTKKAPKAGLTITHIILQVIALIPFVFYFFTADEKRTLDEIMYMNAVIIAAFALFLVASLVHLINFLASLLFKKE